MPRKQIEQIYRAAVKAVDPRACVRSPLEGRAGGLLGGGDMEIDPGDAGIYVIAIGKAADSMSRGVIDALGERLTNGIVVTKEPAQHRDERIDYFEGSHPVPDERSIRAGEAVLDFASGVPDGALVICLISGGGSALVEALTPGIELDDLQQATSRLLNGGAPIQDLNAVRSRLSRIKGGGLLAALSHTRVVNLIVSDVLGDDLQTIASGPTVQRESSESAEDVLERYGVKIDLPPTEERSSDPPECTRVVANLRQAMDAAASEAQRIGLRPVVLADRLEGEARAVGATLAAVMKGHCHELSPLETGDCVLAGGETTVTVRGEGTGGRNTEAALAAALELRGSSRITVGFLATDGDDGVTSAAGAIVDGATISREDLTGALQALGANDSYTFLAGTGAVWEPGATGTNVNDLVIGIIE